MDQIAPDFTLPADDGNDWKLSDLRGKRVLLVFYPGDNTPVCTAQLCDYRDGVEVFAAIGVEVIGISANPAASHQKFKMKYALPFVLLTDADAVVAKTYGAWGMFGIKRAVFLVDETGLVRYAKVETISLFRRHREELVETIQALGQARSLNRS